MSLSPEIIQLLSEKAGYDVTTPNGAYYLSLDIETVAKVKIARNTVGRLTGVIQSNHVPRISTLNAVAKFLGYKSWKSFLEENPSLNDYGISPGKTKVKNDDTCRRSDWTGTYSVVYSIDEQGCLYLRSA